MYLKLCFIFRFTVIAETGTFALSTILFDEILLVFCVLEWCLITYQGWIMLVVLILFPMFYIYNILPTSTFMHIFHISFYPMMKTNLCMIQDSFYANLLVSNALDISYFVRL
jgi:hypothetical protein